jgi:hypothetical protein
VVRTQSGELDRESIARMDLVRDSKIAAYLAVLSALA